MFPLGDKRWRSSQSCVGREIAETGGQPRALAAVFPLEVLQPGATGNEICMRPQVFAISTCQSSIL